MTALKQRMLEDLRIRKDRRTPEEEMTAAYVAAVLTLYLDLPDTPLRPGPLDQSLARKLHEQSVPLPLVESALLLATLRRFGQFARAQFSPGVFGGVMLMDRAGKGNASLRG